MYEGGRVIYILIKTSTTQLTSNEYPKIIRKSVGGLNYECN